VSDDVNVSLYASPQPARTCHINKMSDGVNVSPYSSPQPARTCHVNKVSDDVNVSLYAFQQPVRTCHVINGSVIGGCVTRQLTAIYKHHW